MDSGATIGTMTRFVRRPNVCTQAGISVPLPFPGSTLPGIESAGAHMQLLAHPLNRIFTRLSGNSGKSPRFWLANQAAVFFETRALGGAHDSLYALH